MVQELKIIYTHIHTGLLAQKTNHPPKWAERAIREMNSAGFCKKKEDPRGWCSQETGQLMEATAHSG